MNTELDLVIRNAEVVTASDRFTCDIGVRDGRIAMLGHGLPRAAREMDATGLLALPGGVDGHVHLDQPMPDGMRMADDFFTGTRAAVCGGTTTVIPFAGSPWKRAARSSPRWRTTIAAPKAARWRTTAST